jgi:hypothetical protein
MRFRLFLIPAALLSLSLIAHADKIKPVPSGSFGGTQLASLSGHGGSMDYTESVYQDPNNPFCIDCLDFVLQVSDPDDSLTVGTDVKTHDFAGYTVDLAYEDDGDTAPDKGKISKNGEKITFDFNIFGDEETDPLIIFTNALDYTSGGLTIGSETTDPKAFEPTGAPFTSATPEPSSLLLLGTGLLGFGGIVRRRLTR